MIVALLVYLLPFPALGKGVYMTPETFLAESFSRTQPLIQSLWLTDDIRNNAKRILNHSYLGMRIRYWRANQSEKHRTAWILDEVGKTRPITIGVNIVDDQIERVRILEFRESRGAEVRMPFFTRQFRGLKIKSLNGELSKNIDGITGATLSVTAVKKTARFALYLHRLVVRDHPLVKEQVVVSP